MRRYLFPGLAVLLLLQTPAQGQSVPQRTMTLADMERIALERHPVLKQSVSTVDVAKGRARQAGLPPNPEIGIDTSDVRRRFGTFTGEYGAFIQQEIVLGGKLGKSRNAALQDVRRAEIHVEAQRARVLNTVRSYFYQTLAAQRKLAVRQRLAALVKDAVRTTGQLKNVGQADTPDLLQIEIEDQRAALDVTMAERELRALWTQLSAATGDPSLPPATLEGNLEGVPAIDSQAILARLLAESPEIREAEAAVTRNELALRREQAEKVPNLHLRGGVSYDRTANAVTSGFGSPQGILEVGIQLPLFNRNQGGVSAARAEIEASRFELERVRLSLRKRLASELRDYENLKDIVERYQTALLPRADQAYQMYRAGFQQMAAAYPQVLIAQRTLLQLEDEYSVAIASLWMSAIEIQGLLVGMVE